MARLFEVKEFAARKRALAAESEVYRETLKLELRNFQLYTAALRKRLNPLRHVKTVLPLAGAAAGVWLRRKRAKGQPPLLQKALVGWRLYRTVSPLLRRVAGLLFRRPSSSEEPATATPEPHSASPGRG